MDSTNVFFKPSGVPAFIDYLDKELMVIRHTFEDSEATIMSVKGWEGETRAAFLEVLSKSRNQIEGTIINLIKQLQALVNESAAIKVKDENKLADWIRGM